MELAEIYYGKYLEDFEIEKVEKVITGKEALYEGEVRISFREKAERAPREGLLQNGYQNPIEVIDHTVGGYPTYLKFYRRRWKTSDGREKNLCNQYELVLPGTKVTPQFGAFLKGKDRREIDELCRVYPSLRAAIQEAVSVVQKSPIRVHRPWYLRWLSGAR